MDERKNQLLKLVTESFIASAEPVGSKFLVEEYSLDWSDATVRNELRDLEEAGYLTHPHTSAGRIPTETGYRYYVEHLMEPSVVPKKIKSEIDELGRTGESGEAALKHLGKLVAAEMMNAVLIAFGPHRVYYTGISLLFSQPEFSDASRTVNVSAMFDECEERIDDVFERIAGEDPTILIGTDNPLGGATSLVGARLPGDSLITVLGPLRMDYAKSLGLLSYMHTIMRHRV